MNNDPTTSAHPFQPHRGTPLYRKHQALSLNAAKSLLRNPVRSFLVILCLVALLCPFVTAIAICEGVKAQYRDVLKTGADVYVARDNYGSNAPIELAMMEKLEKIQGVTRVVPRVIGRTYVKEKFLAVLGIHASAIPSAVQVVRGRPPKTQGEVIIGERAATYLDMEVGSRFSIKKSPKQVFRIVGLFQSRCGIWNSDLMIMGFADAARLYGMENQATDLMVYTRPGYEQIVDIIVRLSDQERESGRSPLRVQNMELIDRYSQRGFNIKAGVFTGFYCLVLALGIPSIGVISGFGLGERKREIGVMKALGWQTEEVLEMAALENLILSIISIPFIVIAAAGWIHLFNGIPMAKFFVASFDIIIPFSLPSRIFPIPCLLGILMAVILTMVGSIYSTWKTAVVPPSEAMKT